MVRLFMVIIEVEKDTDKMQIVPRQKKPARACANGLAEYLAMLSTKKRFEPNTKCQKLASITHKTRNATKFRRRRITGFRIPPGTIQRKIALEI